MKILTVMMSMYNIKPLTSFVTARLMLPLFIFVTSFYWIGSDSFISIDAVLLDNMNEYENKEFNYTILYPTYWKLNNETSDHVYFTYTNQNLTDFDPAEDLNPILNISVTKEAISPQLKYVQQITEDQLEGELELSGYQDVSIISRSPFTLGELTGYHIVYSYKLPNYGKVIDDQLLLTKGHDLLYVINFRAEDKEYNSEIHVDVRHMIDSIRISAPLPLLTEKTAQSLFFTISSTLNILNKNLVTLQNLTQLLSPVDTDNKTLSVISPILTEKTGRDILAAIQAGQGESVTSAQNNVTTVAQSKNIACGVVNSVVSIIPGLPVPNVKATKAVIQDNLCP